MEEMKKIRNEKSVIVVILIDWTNMGEENCKKYLIRLFLLIKWRKNEIFE